MTKLRARDIMNPNVLTVPDGMSVRELAQFLVEHQISGAPVVDDEGNLLGVVSLMDIAETASSGETQGTAMPGGYQSRDWEQIISPEELQQLHVEDEGLPVSQIMTPTVYTIPDETPVSEIAKTMVAGRIHRLFVTRDGAVVGILTTIDLLKVLAGMGVRA